VTRTSRLAVALAINGALVVGQVIAGAVAHSTGLLADAGHNLADVAGVGISLLAVRWAMLPRSEARSFGNHRGAILAALFNASALAVVTVAVAAESVYRLIHPEHVDATIVVVVAAAAMVANALSALVLHDRSHDLNMRTTRFHMSSDVAASGCVLVGGVVILASGGSWVRADSVAALVVAALIVVQAARLVRQSADVLLESTPPDVDLATLRATITGVPGVGEVHDLHVWSLSSNVRALSAHLVLTGHPTLEEAQEVGGRVRERVVDPFGIAHTTFELECERCVDDVGDPCGVDDVPGEGWPAMAGTPPATRDDPE
jgi:cobalt-zinc-cadmium efflux system protein